MGYQMLEFLSLDAGHSYQVRKFESGAQAKIHVQTAGLAWQIEQHVRAVLSFEHQYYTSSLAEERSRNNVSSIGVVFRY
jgi:hypothetical protein